MNCMICGNKEDECKFTIVISPAYPRLDVCGECMNQYANQEFDKLTKKLKNREYYTKNKEKVHKHKKEYYEKNKDKISQRKRVKCLCKKRLRTLENGLPLSRI